MSNKTRVHLQRLKVASQHMIMFPWASVTLPEVCPQKDAIQPSTRNPSPSDPNHFNFTAVEGSSVSRPRRKFLGFRGVTMHGTPSPTLTCQADDFGSRSSCFISILASTDGTKRLLVLNKHMGSNNDWFKTWASHMTPQWAARGRCEKRPQNSAPNEALRMLALSAWKRWQ